ncbi:MAG: FtsQ-type POTRA domain-containing protein [Verrucomicrobiota bacterium]
MNRRRNSRTRQKQIHILQATTSKRHNRKRMLRWAALVGMCLITLTTVGVGTHFVINTFIDQALLKNPEYGLQYVKVETRGKYSQRQIRHATGLRKGMNLWALDLQRVQANVERLPFVAEARVEKHLPDKLVIKIKEREPIARVQGLGDFGLELFFVDREQSILFKPRQEEADRLLPLVIGLKDRGLEAGQHLDENPKIKTALELLRMINATSLGTDLDFATIDVGQPLCLRFTTSRGAEFTFRLDYLPEQIARLQEIIAYARERDQRIATVDLTLDRNVPVRFAQNGPAATLSSDRRSPHANPNKLRN